MKQKRSWTLRPIAWLVACLISASSYSLLYVMTEAFSRFYAARNTIVSEKYAPLAVLAVFLIVAAVCVYTMVVLPMLEVQASDFIYNSAYAARYILSALMIVLAGIGRIYECAPNDWNAFDIAVCSTIMITANAVVLIIYGLYAAIQRRRE